MTRQNTKEVKRRKSIAGSGANFVPENMAQIFTKQRPTMKLNKATAGTNWTLTYTLKKAPNTIPTAQAISFSSMSCMRSFALNITPIGCGQWPSELLFPNLSENHVLSEDSPWLVSILDEQSLLQTETSSVYACVGVYLYCFFIFYFIYFIWVWIHFRVMSIRSSITGASTLTELKSSSFLEFSSYLTSSSITCILIFATRLYDYITF